MTDTPLILALAGLVVLAIEIIALIRNKRALRLAFWRHRLILAGSVVVGVFCALGTFDAYYSAGPNWRVYGVPFPYAFFERVQSGWRDYVGLITLPAMVGNAIVAFLSPQLFIAALGLRAKR